MSRLGLDFEGGWRRSLHQPSNPAGTWVALGFAVLLVVFNLSLQWALAEVLVRNVFMDESDAKRAFVKATMVSIFPAALLTVAAAIWLAGLKGGARREVLSLRWPKLSALGWFAVAFGFLAVMYATALVVVQGLGLDPQHYTPGPDGRSPDTGSAGEVKEAMFDIANEPGLFLLVLPSVALGAPLAEEFIFRGQLFSALALTRIGTPGASIVTALLWALMHFSEPWLSVGLIFVMGLVLGYLLYRFGSIWVTILCHGLWNGVFALVVFGLVGAGP